MKGAELSDADRKEVDLRVKYAKKWLENYAPDKYRYVLQEELPKSAQNLDETQKEFAGKLANMLDNLDNWDGENIHGNIHSLVKGNESYTPKLCFQTIYTLFLDKTFGPQAGWFLSALDKDFVIKRLKEIV